MDQAIKAAESALGCGEYRRVLQLLEPLAAELPVTMKLGAEVRLLQATAHQGLGDAERAKQSCRAAAQCGDGELRRQARALLAVLEAPGFRDSGCGLSGSSYGHAIEPNEGLRETGKRLITPSASV